MTKANAVKLTGTIKNYKVTRGTANFVFTKGDTTALGVVAIAAGLGGNAGQAISTASYASSAEEEADFLEFDLDGMAVKGWVWRSPFKEGDRVEAVGEQRGGHLEVIAVARPDDRTVALYPHCSRGRSRHIGNAIKWWFFATSLFLAALFAMLLLTGSMHDIIEGWGEGGSWAVLGVVVFFSLMVYSLARRWMPFVTLAEKAFAAFGWEKPGDIDLVKATKVSRQPGDPGELGTFYFRY